MSNINNWTFIDLFAGIGGFRQALQSYGAKCVFSSEIDKFCKQTYFNNYGDWPEGDITKIDAECIPRHDILCAGFPCQAFSISGKQLGFDDARGTLFFEIIRIVKHHKSRIIFLENVANLAKHDNSNTVKLMIKLLEKEGYTVFIKELNASDFGVSQSRKRLYFVCFRNDLNIKNFEFPKPLNKIVTIKDILENENLTDKRFFIENKSFVLNKEKIVNLPTKKIVRIGTINKGGQGDRIYDINGIGITLSARGGGSASRTGAYYINGKIRKLTPRECARLQGFPEDFKIDENINQAYKQFGNSVAIPVLKEIIIKITKTLFN
ncbi:DNA cytosine methyltransferase [Mycoplasmopsis agassizii]|uniref:Cytosine-specific methyltransferase n=1 Tax=Mycoplasmopsis agassizii TaxID=33922 RepID=A0ABX4H428_9BACT|nr:DNA cytosine methyltransferase [Mycoplasmopsis agassizii]PAF54646.1 DNA (cytosine-5-)-methyltransferase [Mycoplasmopsis agassizii]SMC16186.1 DNA (cytosine-5)-methyltransferase 1 [Mycoplasmopsis agassizii]